MAKAHIPLYCSDKSFDLDLLRLDKLSLRCHLVDTQGRGLGLRFWSMRGNQEAWERWRSSRVDKLVQG